MTAHPDNANMAGDSRAILTRWREDCRDRQFFLTPWYRCVECTPGEVEELRGNFAHGLDNIWELVRAEFTSTPVLADAHPDNANQPPMTDQERRDHYSDGPNPCNPADWCYLCARGRIDPWDGEELNGWTTTMDGDGLCAACIDYCAKVLDENPNRKALVRSWRNSLSIEQKRKKRRRKRWNGKNRHDDNDRSSAAVILGEENCGGGAAAPGSGG